MPGERSSPSLWITGRTLPVRHPAPDRAGKRRPNDPQERVTVRAISFSSRIAMSRETIPTQQAVCEATPALRLVPAAVAASILCLAPQTLARWRWAGVGPRFRKLGSRVVYAVDDLEDWVNANARTSTSATDAAACAKRGGDG